MKLLNKNIFFIFLILINIFIYSTNVSYASCFRVALLGDTGKIIKPDGLAIAMMIGEEKIFVKVLPDHRTQKLVGPTQCPKYLYDTILDLYNLSCTSKTALKQTASNNGINREKIFSRCIDLKVALTAAKF
jgi:hypothetical protein